MLQNELDQLAQSLQFQDWFDSVDMDEFNRPIVYVKYMNLDVLSIVPETYNNIQVLCNFVQSKNVNKELFVERFNSASSALKNDRSKEDEWVPRDLSVLTKELDKLEKVCGSYALQDVFYEIHDGKNAVTNTSARFPEVRQAMEKLYKEYGFDIMYNEMDS